jgi:hypothetical protein
MAEPKTLIPEKNFWYACISEPSLSAKRYIGYPEGAGTPQALYVAYRVTESQLKRLQQLDRDINDSKFSSKEVLHKYSERRDLLDHVQLVDNKGRQNFVAFYAAKNQLCDASDKQFVGQRIEAATPVKGFFDFGPGPIKTLDRERTKDAYLLTPGNELSALKLLRRDLGQLATKESNREEKRLERAGVKMAYPEFAHR